MKKYSRLSARILSVALSVAMVTTMMTATVFSAGDVSGTSGASGLTECHPEHDEECGYITTVEGVSATEEIPCDKACEGEHTADCAYAPATEEITTVAGSPCTHECELCKTQDSGNVGKPACADIAASSVLLDQLLALLANQQAMITEGGADVTDTAAFKALSAEIDALYAHADACATCAAQMAEGGAYYEKFYSMRTIGANVCQMDGTGYPTLQAAFDAAAAAKTDKTITVTEDISGGFVSIYLTETSGYGVITLDLNGHTVSLTGGTESKQSPIRLYGSYSPALEITDSKPEGEQGTLNATGGSVAQSTDGIYVVNGLTISGGTINATGGLNNSGTGSQSGSGIYVYGSGKSLTISGGTVNAASAMPSSTPTTPNQFCGILNRAGNITISGGTITSEGAYSAISLGSNDASYIFTISGTPMCNSGSGASGYTTEAHIGVLSQPQYKHIFEGAAGNDTTVAKDVQIAIAPPSGPNATVGNVTVTGTTNRELSPQSATITLTNETFASALTSTDVASWFTGLPAGVTVTATTAADAKTVTLTFGGTPTAASSDKFVIKIPATNLTGGTELSVVENGNAKFDITLSNTGTFYFDGTGGKLYYADASGNSWTKGDEVEATLTGYTVSGSTLTLNNFTFNTSAQTALYIPGNATADIVLVGNNTLSADAGNVTSYGISSDSLLVISGTGTLTVSGDYGIYSSDHILLGDGCTVNAGGTGKGLGIYSQGSVLMAGATYGATAGAQTNAVLAAGDFLALQSKVSVDDKGSMLSNLTGYSIGLTSFNDSWIVASDLSVKSSGIDMYSVRNAVLFGKCKIDLTYGKYFGLFAAQKLYGALFYGSSLGIRPDSVANAWAAIFCGSRSTIIPETSNTFGGTVGNGSYSFKEPENGNDVSYNGHAIMNENGIAMFNISYDSLELPAPVFSVKPGSYSSTQSVELSCDAALDGDYLNMFTGSSLDSILQAQTAYLPSGSYDNSAPNFLGKSNNAVSDVKMYFTTDGTTPTASSTEYTEAIPVEKTTAIKGITVATLNGENATSATVTGEYRIGESSGGGGGGGSGASSSWQPTTSNTIYSTEGSKGTTSVVSNAIKNAVAAGGTNVAARATFKNFDFLAPDGLKTINQIAAKESKGKTIDFKINLDKVEKGAVVSRIVVDPVALASVITKKLPLGVYFNQQKDKQVTNVNKTFDKFFTNKVVTVSYDQKSPLAVNAEFAAKLDLSGLNEKSLYIYSYNRETKIYTRIDNPNYWADSNGYSHITAPLGGSIIISDSPLAKK